LPEILVKNLHVNKNLGFVQAPAVLDITILAAKIGVKQTLMIKRPDCAEINAQQVFKNHFGTGYNCIRFENFNI
jgi:hypothetical protein